MAPTQSAILKTVLAGVRFGQSSGREDRFFIPAMPSARCRSAHHLAVDAATMNITAERIVTCADPELPAYVQRHPRAFQPAGRPWSAVFKLLGGDVHGDGGVLRADHR